MFKKPQAMQSIASIIIYNLNVRNTIILSDTRNVLYTTKNNKRTTRTTLR